MARDSKGKLVECGNEIETVNELNYGQNKFLKP